MKADDEGVASRPAVVFDVNTLISAALLPGSQTRRAFDRAVAESNLLVSYPLIAELNELIHRPKFDRYISVPLRIEFLHAFVGASRWIDDADAVTACRDPKDNYLLDLALDGRARWLVTGDADLLALDPFDGVRIVKPSAFLKLPALNG